MILLKNIVLKYESFNVNQLPLKEVLHSYERFRYAFRRKITARLRILPDFLIIGAGKCGTTSLYDYLVQHPCIYHPLWKEVHYFDTHYKYGINWYRSHFPTIFQKFCVIKLKGNNFITGEASPYYLFHPLAAERVANIIPKVKLIIILRNPIERAYSQYHHEVRNNNEPLSFEEAIKNEEKRLEGKKEKILKEKNYNSINFPTYSYLLRGIYIDQIHEWIKYFPRHQFLILRTEDFDKDAQSVVNKVFQFLGLSSYNKKNFVRHNVGKYSQINSQTREFLKDYFKPYNEQLNKFIGNNFGWD